MLWHDTVVYKVDTPVGRRRTNCYLNLVLEYVPETVYRVARHFTKAKLIILIIDVKVYMYQLFRSLAYIHSQGVCHRDIKPQNLLVDPDTAVLKLCDFGSAKQLVRGEPNVSYICSRYYRAPELIFGATDYTSSIDVWSAGCGGLFKEDFNWLWGGKKRTDGVWGMRPFYPLAPPPQISTPSAPPPPL